MCVCSRLSPSTWRVTGVRRIFEEGKKREGWGVGKRKRQAWRTEWSLPVLLPLEMAQLLGSPEDSHVSTRSWNQHHFPPTSVRILATEAIHDLRGLQVSCRPVHEATEFVIGEAQ